jgi:hypothetical protein
VNLEQGSHRARGFRLPWRLPTTTEHGEALGNQCARVGWLSLARGGPRPAGHESMAGRGLRPRRRQQTTVEGVGEGFGVYGG